MDRRIYATPFNETRLDPIAALREIVLGSNGEINGWLAAQRGDDLLAAAVAETKIVPLARRVFSLPAWSPENDAGYTDDEVLRTLDHFCGWLQGKGGKG